MEGVSGDTTDNWLIFFPITKVDLHGGPAGHQPRGGQAGNAQAPTGQQV